jgi:type II secretory pathway pseudopilin PulG
MSACANPRRIAFTLVELLVVITIIIVLLALLAPGLDKAIYQARLAVCGANLRSLGWMATSYAQDNKRYYPERRITLRPMATLSTTQDATPGTVDDRVLSGGRSLSDWVPLNKVLNDPQCEKIDVEGSLSGSELELPYHLWWSFRYINNGSVTEQGMYRLYGKFSYTPDPNNPSFRYTFDVLASDLEALNGSGPVSAASGSGTAFTSHPDRDNVTYNLRLQDEAEPGGNATSTRYTYTKWMNRNTGRSRPPVDLNYVRSDMSVSRYDAVTYDEQFKGKRMVNVPWLRSVQHNFSFITHLPTH